MKSYKTHRVLQLQNAKKLRESQYFYKTLHVVQKMDVSTVFEPHTESERGHSHTEVKDEEEAFLIGGACARRTLYMIPDH